MTGPDRAVTEFMLWNIIGFIEALGPGSLRCFIILDEAHKLSFNPGSPVEKLLREGRKFGLGLILASQQPEDFSSVAVANAATKTGSSEGCVFFGRRCESWHRAVLPGIPRQGPIVSGRPVRFHSAEEGGNEIHCPKC